MTDLPPGVTRRKIPFLANDIVTVSDPTLIRKIAHSKEIGRPAETQLPLLFRLFFTGSKFYHLPSKRYALPQEGTDINDTTTRRQIIEQQLATGFTDAHIQQLVSLVKSNTTYEQVGKECAKIIADLILPLPEGQRLPDDVALAAFNTLIEVETVFNPIRYLKARSSRRKVEEYLEELMPDDPNQMDYAHNLGAAAQGIGAAVLSMREMATDDVNVHFNNNPIIRAVLRVPLVDTTLDDTFPEDAPLRTDNTIIALDIGGAATEMQDKRFLFGTGDDIRQCPFKNLFFQATTEVKKRMVAPS